MPKKCTEDFTGKKFNRFTVVGRANHLTGPRQKSGWLCACECGNQRLIPHSIVRTGNRMSCGCYRNDFHKVDPRGKFGKFDDLTGRVFGKLTVVGMSHRDEETGHYFFKCRCSCGNESTVIGSCLKRGDSKSCGCWTHQVHKKHGELHRGPDGKLVKSKEYTTWMKIKGRCTCQTDSAWSNYGGRGIRICDEWKDDFAAFLSHVGRAPTKRHSIDRIDVNGNYEPGNVRWATAEEQARNRRNNAFIDFRGKRMVKAAFARALGIDHTLLNYWLKKGKTPEEIYEIKKDTPKDVLCL